MRGILMMMGVILHACRFYNPAQTWVVYGTNNTIVANYIAESIHVFRMPAFFVVSGFFCVLTIRRYRPQEFLQLRFKRIVVPLVVTALTLNTIQTVATTYAGFGSFDWKDYVLHGGWVFHLWFLNILIVYFALATALAAFAGRFTEYAGKQVERLFLSVPVLAVILMLPLSTLAIFALNKYGLSLRSNVMGIFDVFNILRYLPYFAFGGILAISGKLLNRFSSVNPIVSLLLISIVLLVLEQVSDGDSLSYRITTEYLQGLIVWLAISVCFYVSFAFMSKPSKIWLFLSDASYSVYLFHHIIVVFLGLVLIRLDMPALLGLPLLIVTTAVLSLIIHRHFIVKYRITRYLFNGK